MEFIVPAICGIVLILGIVAIVMSRSNWKIPQMILMFFILIFSLGFFYMAARNLRTRENWEKEVHDYQARILETTKGPEGGGEAAALAIEQLRLKRDALRHEATDAMAERGRVWPGAIKKTINQANGEIQAQFDQGAPPGPDVNAIVFVFEEAEKDKDKGGKYLGEFTVTATGNQVTLKPAGTPVQSELNTIKASKGPWVLYEIMPGDSHTLFSEGGEGSPNLQKLLPEDVRQEYARDGKPAKYDLDKERTNQPAGNDPADHVKVRVKFLKAWPETAAAPAPMPMPAGPPADAAKADATKADDGKTFKPGDVAYLDVVGIGGKMGMGDKKELTIQNLVDAKIVEYDKSDPAKPFLIYSRPLRDYAHLFREAYRKRNELFDRKTEFDAQAAQIAEAAKQVEADAEVAKTQKAGLTADLKKFKAEEAAVIAFNATLDAKIAETRKNLSELFKKNLQLSAQLADVERKVYDAIRAKTPPAEASASVRP